MKIQSSGATATTIDAGETYSVTLRSVNGEDEVKGLQLAIVGNTNTGADMTRCERLGTLVAGALQRRGAPRLAMHPLYPPRDRSSDSHLRGGLVRLRSRVL